MNRGRVKPSMETLESDQRLQKITLSKVPVPDKNIDCQSLLRQGVSYQGWLRRKKPGKFTDVFNRILPSAMTWDQMYVVICKGCLYFYNNESEKKPHRAVSLFGYTRVMRAGEFQMKQGGGLLWPFKVAYVLDEHDRVHYLSAPCEADMMKWLKHIKLELYKANGVEYSDDCITDEDIHDLETPISTGNYFSRITDLNRIKDAVDDDSDLDDEYEYIDPDDATSKPKFSDVSSISSHDAPKKALPPPPAKPQNKASSQPPQTPSKPQKNVSSQLPQPPTKPQDKAPSQSQVGYYPPSSLNLNTPSSASGNRLPGGTPATATKKLNKPDTSATATPTGRPQPPPVNAKQKPPKEANTPSGESSSSLVADLKKALDGQMAVPVKAKTQTSKSPDHIALSETKSSSKPLPPLPGLSRISNAPTAVVMPIRQSAATQQSRFAQDLEASALWRQDAGEGQRLLMSSGSEGDYMLRYCSDGSQLLTLLVISDYQLRKYKVFRNEDGMFSLQTDFRPGFDSVHNLLNYYRTSVLPNRTTTLSRPCSELQTRR